ncbi:MAG: TorD/DmsD family molecular chaperone [Gaiellaceae bacterium]
MTTLVESGTGRAALWRLLSLGSAHPSAESFAEVEALAEAVLELEGSPAVGELLAAIRASTPEELEAERQSLFGGSVAVAPYEGSYEVDPVRQGRQLADVAGFYRAFGAEAHGPAAERPDHVGCELEFLAFLELERMLLAESDDESGADLVDEIAGSFVRDHAGRWLPAFFAGVREAAKAGSVFAALAALGERAVAEEVERRGVEPSPLPRRHARLSVEQDAFDCGAAS